MVLESANHTGELASVLQLSQTYPGFSSLTVDRPTLLGTLDDLMGREFDAIFLEGPDESGKTTALAQFAKAHESHIICLFLRPVTEFTYDPVRIRFELSNQITWSLFGTELPGDVQPDGGQLRALYQRLERKATQDRRPIFFVVDGLADIPTEAAGIQKAIVSMLPIGARAFRFLFAGSPSANGVSDLPKSNMRSQQISAFGPEESHRLFAGLASREQIDEIHRTCKGHIGSMASVRRLLTDGMPVASLIESLPDFVPKLFEIEWQRLPLEDETAKTILAVSAFAPEIASLDRLAALTQRPSNELQQVLQRLTCVHLQSTGQGIRYVTESFRQFASRKLASAEKPILERIVAALSVDTFSQDVFRTLPEYLERVGDITALIRYLSTDTIAHALSTTRSIAMVSSRLGRAAKLSLAHEAPEAAVRYQIQRAVLRGILNRRGRQRYIEAALATAGEGAAVELASRAFADEERLHMLAVIARFQRARGLLPESQTLSEIRRLADSIEWSELRDQALEIGAELLPALPDVAINIIERSVAHESRANALEAAVATAFVSAAARRNIGGYRNDLLDNVMKSAPSKSKGHIFATTATLALADSVADLFADISRVQGTSEKVFLLRLWLERNTAHIDAYQVARRLLDTILNDSQFSPNASQFVGCVGVVSLGQCSPDDGQQVVKVVEAQLPTLSVIGPTVEVVRLFCELAVAKARLGNPDFLAQLAEKSFELERHQDPSTKAASFAWIRDACTRIGVGSSVADDLGLSPYVDQMLSVSIHAILSSSANQSDAITQLVRPLCARHMEYLLSVVKKMNTVNRRDEVYEEIAAEFANDASVPILKRLEACSDILGKVLSVRARDRLARRFITIAARGLNGDAERIADLIAKGGVVDCITDPDDIAIALAELYATLSSSDQMLPGGIALLARIRDCWLATEKASLRMNSAFSIVTKLCESDKKNASLFYEDGRRLATSEAGLIASSSEAIRLTLFLLGRSIASLERASVATTQDWARFVACVKRLPSKCDQASIWAITVLHVARSKRSKAVELVESELKPLLRELATGGLRPTSEFTVTLIVAAPALWIFHSASINEFVSQLDIESRDAAYTAILRYLLMGEIPAEPWTKSTKRSAPITYETALDVLSLLEMTSFDASFYFSASPFLRALRDRQHPPRANRGQLAELIRRVRELTSRKIPEAKYGIQHEGYVIVLEAELAAAEGSGTHEFWKDLVSRSRALPNVADIVFVLACLVDAISNRYESLRRTVFDELASHVPKLPLIEDRMDRVEFISDTCQEHFSTECKRLVKSVLDESMAIDRPGMTERRATLLDLMHRMDPDAAAAFASATDSDPVKQRTRAGINRELADLRAGKQLRDSVNMSESDVEVSRLADACWQELGYLLSARVTSRTYKDNLELLRKIHDADIDDVFPIVSYAIEATSTRYEQTSQAGEYLRPLFLALVEANDLAIVAATVSESSACAPEEGGQAELEPTTFHVAGGTRLQVLEKIRGWISTSPSATVKLVDPYFSHSDLVEFFELLPPGARPEVEIVTSMRGTEPKDGRTRKAAFEAEWQKVIARCHIPYCRVVIVGTKKSGLFSIHNRWLILDELGIDLGTSLNSLGAEKSCVISRLDPAARAKCLADIDSYLLMQPRYFDEERLIYEVFSLS